MPKKPSKGKYIPVRPSQHLGPKRSRRASTKGPKRKHVSPNKGLPYFEYVPVGPEIRKKAARLLPKERQRRAIKMAEEASKIIQVFQKGKLARKNEKIIEAVQKSVAESKTRKEVEREGQLLVQRVKNYWDAMLAFAKVKEASPDVIKNLENMKQFYAGEAESFIEAEWKKRTE